MIADSSSSSGVVAALVIIGLILYLVYRSQTQARKTISQVGRQKDGSLRCPKCGGAQFTAKRSAIGKAGMGLLAPKSQVKCVTCGTIYKRG